MVSVGFIVEGDTEKCVVESEAFRSWLQVECGCAAADPVVNANGKDNLLPHRLPLFVTQARKAGNPDVVVVLADLDPDPETPCISVRKERIAIEGVDLVIIARPSIEAWFLADTKAMQSKINSGAIFESDPESLSNPWERVRDVLKEYAGRGPGTNKLAFAKSLVDRHGFEIKNAARHPACPSAAYAVARLRALSPPA